MIDYQQQQDIQGMITKAIDDRQYFNAYNPSLIPVHAHTGTDSQQIDFFDIANRLIFLNYTLFGTNAATSGNYSTFFIASYPLNVLSVKEVHTVLGTDGGAVSLQIEKLTGTTAPGGGTVMLSTAFDLKSTINTVVTGTLLGTTIIHLNTGDRLALKLTGTPTSVANMTVSLVLVF